MKWLAAIFVLTFWSNRPIFGQEEPVRPLRLDGIAHNGFHSTLTESWVTVEVTVANPNTTARDARVALFYADHPDLQYVRDMWIPPRSSLQAWMLVGPVPATRGEGERRGSSDSSSLFSRPLKMPPHTLELQALIYDRTGNQERLLLPRGEERFRSRLVGYRPREPLTCLLTDETNPDEEIPEYPEPREPEPDAVLELARAFRAGCVLSESVQVMHDNFLPPTPMGFDGVDHIILAGGRLAHDPLGQVALRCWLEQGGRLWVMLDRTDENLVARILGGVAGFQVVDRISLPSFRIEGPGSERPDTENTTRDFDEPVDFVRVKVGESFSVVHTVNGWPASFTRPVGQGRVVITTLGARGWDRPRGKTDTSSPFPNFPQTPVLVPAADTLIQELLSPPPVSFPTTIAEGRNVLGPLVSAEIGYSVVGIGTAGMMFGGFLLALGVFGLGLRRWRRSEFLGWIGPVTALSAAGAFLALGEAGRRSVPPTLAVAQMVAVNPQASEQTVAGLLGFYRPESGPTELSSNQDGMLELDMAGLEGQKRRLVVTDIDNWHWDNLALPAGVRSGSFRAQIRHVEPVGAVARFGPDGLEGRISPGPFQNLADALVYSPSNRAYAVHLRPDGAFAAAGTDLLPTNQFVAGTVLSDQQQRRQAIYQRLLDDAKTKRTSENGLLLAWADPCQLPFSFQSGVRSTGSALLSFPLEFEHAPPNTQVTVPRAFIGYRRIIPLGLTQPTLEGLYSIEEHLRFQLPSSVLPMKVERARLFAKVDAPRRRFIVNGLIHDQRVELRNVQDPVDVVSLEIERPEVLDLDEQGGLHLEIAISDPEIVGEGLPPKWSIQSLELEIIGQTEAGK